MKNKLLSLFVASSILLSGGAVLSALPGDIYEAAWAASNMNPENSQVLDDLLPNDTFKEFYLDGSTYAADNTEDDFDIISVYEYNYRQNSSFTIYIYVFNKSGVGDSAYNFSYENNRIQMLEQSSGAYEHFNIVYLNRSNDNRFIKYKCVIPFSKNVVNGNYRDYSISGIEIGHYVNVNSEVLTKLTEYEHGHSWRYSGDSNDLTIQFASDLEYLSPEIKGGVYRTESANANLYTDKNDLFYVYFDVPSSIQNDPLFELYSVHADYYKFDLVNCIASIQGQHDFDYYEDLLDDYINATGASKEAIKNQIMEFKGSPNDADVDIDAVAHYVFDKYDFGAAADQFRWTDGSSHDSVFLHTINSFVSNDNNTSIDGAFLFQVEKFDDPVDGHIVGNRLDLDTAERLSGQRRNQLGVYNNVHLTVDDEFDLEQWGDHHSDWERFWRNIFNGGGFTSAYTDYDINDVKAIEHVKKSDNAISDSSFASKYLVSESDADSLKTLLSSNTKEFYLFRFCQALYCPGSLEYNYMNVNGNLMTYNKIHKVGTWVNKMTAIIDFDVVDMTFVNEYGDEMVLPVVHSPINIIGDVTAPSVGGIVTWDFSQILRILMIIAIVLIALIVLRIIFKISNQHKLNVAYREAKRQRKEERLKKRKK